MASFDLTGRLALVTGATGTLGGAFCRALAEANADVLLVGRHEGRIRSAAGELGERAAGVLTVELSQPESIDALFEEVGRRHGRLDILVNNAGIARRAPFGEVSPQDLHDLHAINVVAPYLCAQHAARLMRPKGGKIVNVGSIYGSVAVDHRIYEGAPDMVPASPAYVASKSALVNLTRELAVRLAPDQIQVNLLSPGGVIAGQPEPFIAQYCERTPAGRMAQPQDVGGTLVYLCAGASDYVTGQNIHVDGGFTAW